MPKRGPPREGETRLIGRVSVTPNSLQLRPFSGYFGTVESDID